MNDLQSIRYRIVLLLIASRNVIALAYFLHRHLESPCFHNDTVEQLEDDIDSFTQLINDNYDALASEDIPIEELANTINQRLDKIRKVMPQLERESEGDYAFSTAVNSVALFAEHYREEYDKWNNIE